jgi:N-acetylglucosaminyl-diphospho-decaprenol L-rhamnosyltransferase
MTSVDIVVVAYQSRDRLRDCVQPLLGLPDVRVIVADNASPDCGIETIADLDVTCLRLPRNGGFAYGCNAGWTAGRAEYVMLLNPDATIDAASLQALVAVLDADEGVGAVAPQILDGDGHREASLRRFPRLRSTYAQALFLHRVFPRASWTDELIQDPAVYDRPGTHEWVSGACILVRRSALAQLRGLDDGFFLYCEDIDLCRRLADHGLAVRYEPAATAGHAGGASRPRVELYAVLAASRVRYAAKHRGRLVSALERGGIVLGALTHAVLSPDRAARAGYRAALRAALRGQAPPMVEARKPAVGPAERPLLDVPPTT